MVTQISTRGAWPNFPVGPSIIDHMSQIDAEISFWLILVPYRLTDSEKSVSHISHLLSLQLSLSSDNFLFYKQFVCSLNTIFVFLGPKLPAQHIVHGFGLTGCHWQERTSVTGILHVGSIFDFHFSLQVVAHNLVECPWWVTTPNVLVVVGIHVNILVSGRLWTNK